MHKRTTHSKSGLFLMEMILSVFFLVLVCTVCVQLLAAAHTSRRQAREWNRIQEAVTTAGEVLEGWDGALERFPGLFPWKMEETAPQTYESYFDRNFAACGKENAAYRLELWVEAGNMEKLAKLAFYRIQGEELYAVTIRYPRFSGKEASS